MSSISSSSIDEPWPSARPTTGQKPLWTAPEPLPGKRGNAMTMSGKMRYLMGVGIITPAVASTSAMAATLDGAQYLKDAKIKLTDARAMALKIVNGKIVAEELEHESGGSGLRYSFDIKKGGVTHEVGIDAKTGKVLENSVEGRGKD